MLLAYTAALAAGCAQMSGGRDTTTALRDTTHLDRSGGHVSVVRRGDTFCVIGEDDGTFAVSGRTLRTFHEPLDGFEVVRCFEASGNPDNAQIGPEHASGLRVTWVADGQGSPMRVDFDTGGVLSLSPAPPVREILSAGLADVTGDGIDDLVVTGVGDPAICKCTRTGYVGFSEGTVNGTFGDVKWQKPLKGGLASILIENIDGEPGSEIIAGMYDTFCSSAPAGIWVFSPGPP